jgi:uncharacterized transporter YbjL
MALIGSVCSDRVLNRGSVVLSTNSMRARHHTTREANSDAPNVTYAAVYQVAMIAKIILAQLLT